jgi:type IV secretion system protein VirB1
MQIHTSNLSPLKLTLARAFDPCASLEAGAEILRAAYVKGATPAEREAALLIAYSRYNTGRTLDGIVNVYAPDVVMRTNQDQALVGTSEQRPADSTPANWDVWAAGSRSNQPLPWFSDYSASHPPVLLVGTPTSAQPSTAGD